jgi:uncharacterized protein (DUF427 family)
MSWTKSYSAMWQNEVLAKCEKKKCIELDGNIYFPPESVKFEFLSESDKKTVCNWKGEASHYNITVNKKVNGDAALVYKSPKPEASKIKGMIVFFKGVTIENTS